MRAALHTPRLFAREDQRALANLWAVGIIAGRWLTEGCMRIRQCTQLYDPVQWARWAASWLACI